MSHLRVKTTYEVEGAYGSTEVKTLYCHHNLSSDCVTFYDDDEDSEVTSMVFESFSNGKNLWDAMEKLWFPFIDTWGKELLEGVEYYQFKMFV